MLNRFGQWGFAAAAMLLLASGCAAPKGETSTAPKSTEEATKSPTGPRPRGRRVAEAHAHYGAAVIHDMNQETEAALAEYYQAAMLDPDDESLVLEVSRHFLQQKQPEKAAEVLTRATARPNAPGSIYARLGMVYSQLGRSADAIAANRIAISKAPASLAGYQNLFVEYAQTKRPGEAMKVLDEAAGQTKASPEFLLGLAECYVNFSVQFPAQKEAAKQKGLALLERAAKATPSTPLNQLRVADGFSALGEASRASPIYLELLKKLPDVPAVRERIRGRLADIYLKGSDHGGAREQLEAIVRDDPTNAQAVFYLGLLAVEEKRWADAEDAFSKSVLLNPGLEQAYYELALAELSLNKTSDALANLERARKRFQQNFIGEFITGMAFSRQKAYSEAIQHFTAAEVVGKATDPKRLDHNFYFQFGAVCERKGDLAQAEKHFSKALQLTPNFPEAENYLGYMWAEHGTNLDEARELIESALKAEPTNAAYLDSMGWVLFQQGHPEEALTYVQKAVELTEEPDPTLLDHLGDILAAVRKPEPAREAWLKSLKLEPNPAIQKKLEGLERSPPADRGTSPPEVR